MFTTAFSCILLFPLVHFEFQIKTSMMFLALLSFSFLPSLLLIMHDVFPFVSQSFSSRQHGWLELIE